MIDHTVRILKSVYKFAWDISHCRKKWARFDTGLRVKYLLFLSYFKSKFDFLDVFSKKFWNIMCHQNPYSPRRDFSRADGPDGRTDGRDEANSLFFSQCCEQAKKKLCVNGWRTADCYFRFFFLLCLCFLNLISWIVVLVLCATFTPIVGNHKVVDLLFFGLCQILTQSFTHWRF